MAAPVTVVVAEAPDPVQAEIWLAALRDAGIAAGSYERGVGAALGGASTAGFAFYPIVVAESDLGTARSIIAEIAGASFLAPVRGRAASRAGQRQALIVVGIITAGILLLGLTARLVAG